jgi:hypothetical protein
VSILAFLLRKSRAADLSHPTHYVRTRTRRQAPLTRRIIVRTITVMRTPILVPLASFLGCGGAFSAADLAASSDASEAAAEGGSPSFDGGPAGDATDKDAPGQVDASPDAPDAGSCTCVLVPADWTLAEGSGWGGPAVGCDSSYQGGTVTYTLDGAAAAFTCAPASSLAACDAGGICAPTVGPGLALCLTHPGAASCPAGYSNGFTGYANGTTPMTICCRP